MTTEQVAISDEDVLVEEGELLLPYAFARRHGIVIKPVDEGMELFCRRPLAVNAFAEVRRRFGELPTPKVLDDERFEATMALVYEQQRGAAAEAADNLEGLDLTSLVDALPQTADLLEQEDDAPIIRLINALLQEAIRENASDIHIETFERRLSVRMRIDGVLRTVLTPRRELAPLLVSRIKVMARLDIAEKRVPQDGRISLRLGGRDVDVRVSTMPSSNGERVVLRLLDKQAGRLQLGHLGMGDQCYQLMRGLIHKPHG
ncbi:MAG: ATPase, T2SS/T4P/T4SS family, partial [Alcanivoracaceae bacterium]|nr:ATPase, T2SS/T4P/T4SS family [Alcanivoracaceae bacterium]